MRVGSDRLESLPSPAFISAVALLVVNDFALKPLFHNVVTGKLSDFAGLFALTLFVATTPSSSKPLPTISRRNLTPPSVLRPLPACASDPSRPGVPPRSPALLRGGASPAL